LNLRHSTTIVLTRFGSCVFGFRHLELTTNWLRDPPSSDNHPANHSSNNNTTSIYYSADNSQIWCQYILWWYWYVKISWYIRGY